MLRVRYGKDRGHAAHGWLDTRHTFSFDRYMDPEHMGFRALRVVNEDRIAPSKGFGFHGHRDMEILTYILEGELEHKDSLGARGILRSGEVQYMSAGTGVRHSETNPSATEVCHLLQIWMLPNRMGLTPQYGQKKFSIQDQPDKLHRIASQEGSDGSFLVHSDAELYAAKLSANGMLEWPLRLGHGWLQVARGALVANEMALQAGDGLAISDEKSVRLATDTGAEVLLFDLA